MLYSYYCIFVTNFSDKCHTSSFSSYQVCCVSDFFAILELTVFSIFFILYLRSANPLSTVDSAHSIRQVARRNSIGKESMFTPSALSPVRTSDASPVPPYEDKQLSASWSGAELSEKQMWQVSKKPTELEPLGNGAENGKFDDFLRVYIYFSGRLQFSGRVLSQIRIGFIELIALNDKLTVTLSYWMISILVILLIVIIKLYHDLKGYGIYSAADHSLRGYYFPQAVGDIFLGNEIPHVPRTETNYCILWN